MLTVNMLDTKTHLSKLVRFAEKLEGKRIGVAKGRVEMPDDIVRV